MARGVLNVQQVALSGLTPAYGAGNAVDGHQFANEGETMLHVKNAGVSPCTVTIKTNGYKVGGITIPDQTVVVPANNGDKQIGPFDPTIFNQVGGVVWIDLSEAAGVTLGAFKM